ncbi:MAG: 3-deoxy-manno-octulosonate cytidylyltransferase [Bacteroidota bacterium]|jgi:3-deoxy-manno-octulosonate cytidylyltransferase (CMP-KDO synthetase)
MKILGVIPARFASTRFPGKPLVAIAGKSMVQRVYEQACKATGLADVFVATDDQRIFDHVAGFGGKVIMTSNAHPSGTDRILEVAAKMPEFEAYINIQGDEPYIDPLQIDQVCGILNSRQGAYVGTLVKRLADLTELQNPNTIKAVFAMDGQAIYFSRSPIPYMRDATQEAEFMRERGYFKHIGIYGYSKEGLGRIREMQRGLLERAESLEQLRWMEHGLPIYVAETTLESQAVDAPEDLIKLERLHS